MTANDAAVNIAAYLEAHPDDHIIVAAHTRAELQSIMDASSGLFQSVMLSLGMSAPDMAKALDAFGLGGVRVLFANIRMCTGWRVLRLDAVIMLGDKSRRKVECLQMCIRQADHQAELIEWEDLTDE